MTMRIIGDGALAVALTRADESDTVFVIADAGADPLETAALLRRAVPPAGGAVVLLVPAAGAALDRQLVLAMIPLLASELAPATRVSAVDIAPDAATATIVEAAAFLAAATSTTGQVLRVGGQPRVQGPSERSTNA